MCGIFGYVLKTPLPLNQVFQVLKKLEKSKSMEENETLGGYGAGVAIMLPDGNVITEKVGKMADSPAAQLEEIMKQREFMGSKITEASVLLGHVRFPSIANMGTVKFKEAAQPYVGQFQQNLKVVSVHNGEILNYKEIMQVLKGHTFESEKVGFIDSEVIPHYFDELIQETEDNNSAVYELLCSLKGSNAIGLLQIDGENAWLHIIYKGKGRGLVVWANDESEVIFCSRPKPVKEVLSGILRSGKFYRKVFFEWQEETALKLTFSAIIS